MALLQTEVTCQSPKTANWPRAEDAGSDTLRDSARKNPNFMQFYKIVPARPSPPVWDGAAGVPQLCSKKSQFYAIL
jgi:hypothetical protein